jgi:putative tricarboxylic transport membrane protein
MKRREFLSSAAACAAVAGTAGFAARAAVAQTAKIAQTVESLRIIVPAAAGGGWDLTGRTMGKVLRQIGGIGSSQVENIAGAGGSVALPQFLRMEGEHDIVMVTGFTMISACIANKSPYSITETTPIARLTGEAHVLVVPWSSPIKTLEDFIAALKANPKALSVTGGTPGGSDHITLGMIASLAGVNPRDLNWVAYNGGGQAQTALMGNHVHAGISSWSEFAGQIEGGRLRALGVSSEKKIAGTSVPSFKEQGVDVVLLNWRGVFAPPKATDEEKARLAKLVADMVASTAWRSEVDTRKWLDLYLPAGEFTSVLSQEVASIKSIMGGLGFV